VRAEVLVDLRRIHRSALAAAILELEQVPTPERAAPANDVRDPCIGNLDPVPRTTLSVEVEHRSAGASEAHVTVPERG